MSQKDNRLFKNGQNRVSTNIFENQFEIIGNVGTHKHDFRPTGDAENCYLRFSICTERYNAAEKKAYKRWVHVVVFNNLAIACHEILRVGRSVRILGHLETNKVERTVTAINGQQFTFNDWVTSAIIHRVDGLGNSFDVNYGVARPEDFVNSNAPANNNFVAAGAAAPANLGGQQNFPDFPAEDDFVDDDIPF